jgi:antitoxin (DNA-binding transcriptional repressor) of toxin-antitoxin stability system
MMVMSEHTIAEAESRLSDLIDRALAGEGVVITCDGHPAVELRPVAKIGRPPTALDLDWLAQRRVGSRQPSENAGTLVSRMRDEDER